MHFCTVESRKRRSEQRSPEPVKKPALNKRNVSFDHEIRSTHCSEPIVKGAVATDNGKVYFASGSSIHVLNATHKKPHWLPKIECNRKKFGLTAINNMLFLVGGIMKGKPIPSKPESSVQCYSLNNAPKTWEEKYPNMAVARFDPEVVSYQNYVIVIAGWTTNPDHSTTRPELSVEIFNMKEEQWYSIDNMKLPDYLDSMLWMSACICDDTLYLTAMHDDPKYEENTAPEEEDDDDDSTSEDFSHCYPDPYTCCSLFQCFISDFSQMDSFTWQVLNHPHPATYENDDSSHFLAGKQPTEEERRDYFVNFGFPDEKYKVKTSHFHYGDCKYSLVSIDSQLFAVGSNHIEAVPPNEMQDSLIQIYDSYMNIKAVLNEYEYHDDDDDSKPYETVIDHENSYDPRCTIHKYDPDKDVWEQLYTIEDLGCTSDHPLAASVDNLLVVARSTTDARVVHYKLLD